MDSGEKSQHVRSVQRAARIVTTLAEHPYAMGVLELAERVQLSPGSVHRLLSTLVSVGWVEQNSRTAKYRLGTHILGIGTTGLLTHPATNVGTPFLARLAEWSGHDALLSTLVGMRTVSLARVASSQTLRPALSFEPGLAQPAHASADGKVLLSYLPKEERLYLYAVEGLPRYTANTIVDVNELEREIEAVQARGYATDNGERFDDSRGLAVPVLGPDQRLILAMHCIGGLDLSEEWLSPAIHYLKHLAQEMSERLLAIGDLTVAEPGPASRSRTQASRSRD